jgi:hypothetical protein
MKYSTTPSIAITLDYSRIIQIQTRLNELGYGPLAVDGLFGKATILSVKAYQMHNFYPESRPLTVDGIVGLLTWWSLFDTTHFIPAQPSPLLSQAIEIARREIGVTEVPPGSNSGPKVDEYLRSTGLGPGYPWCASFVYWDFEQASLKLNRVNPLIRTASCNYHWINTRGVKISRNLAMANNNLIEPGAIFIIKMGPRGHTGIVTDVHDGMIQTIEGNANAFHSAEGIGVVALQRKIETINAGFIIYC